MYTHTETDTHLQLPELLLQVLVALRRGLEGRLAPCCVQSLVVGWIMGYRYRPQWQASLVGCWMGLFLATATTQASFPPPCMTHPHAPPSRHAHLPLPSLHHPSNSTHKSALTLRSRLSTTHPTHHTLPPYPYPASRRAAPCAPPSPSPPSAARPPMIRSMCVCVQAKINKR